MIGYLRGKIINARWGKLIVDVGGVGYLVSVDPQIKIPDDCVATKYEVELYIHEHIREDAHDLYGFLDYQSLETFRRLVSVSGVGPKAGMNIIVAADTLKIYKAIENSDVSFFTAISGIGKKVAAKIILELKSKMTDSDSSDLISGSEGSNDVIEAMASLGYKKSDIGKFVSQIPAEIITTEEKVRWLLKNMNK